MEGSGECCVVSNNCVERQNELVASEVTLVQDPVSPLPSFELKNEETPLIDRAVDVEDNSVIQQGRLLFLTPHREQAEAADEKCTNHGPSPSVTGGEGVTKELKDVVCVESESGVVSEKPTVTSPSQVSPKLVKQKLSKEQREALRQERERLRVEKEKERAEAKAKREEEKEKKKLEKQRKDEEKRERQRKKELEMKERQEKREREEQEKKERREKREAEKQRKDDEKRKKEEERRQVEMEKEQAKEEKIRKQQAAQKRIVSFFQVISPKEATQSKTTTDSDLCILTPFPVKPDVTLATPPRSPLRDTSHFDAALSRQDVSVGGAYLDECKCKLKIKSGGQDKACDKTNECEDMEVDDDVIVTSSDTVERRTHRDNVRYKLLQFHTNHRPAYFGSWRRRSGLVSARNPFRKDPGLLDYEVDSDDEWEEEEPGESLSNSEGEDGGAESGDDDEEDDGFFVPHGYLSDSEGDHSGDEGTKGQDNHDLKQQKQVSKAKAWEAEFSRKCQPLRPIKIGCVWSGSDNGGGVASTSKDVEFLRKFEAVPLVELPVAMETKGETTAEGSATESNKPRAVPEEAMPDLIRLLHKSSMGLGRLMKTFRMHWGAKVRSASSGSGDPIGVRDRSSSPSDEITKTGATSVEASPFSMPKTPGTGGGGGGSSNQNAELENASGISKRQLEKKIQAIATKEVRPASSKQLWYVHDAVLEKYGMDGNSITPLVTSPPSVGTKLGGDSGAHAAPSPQTPSGSGAARKRPKGMKSLFDFVSPSRASASGSKAGGDGKSTSTSGKMELGENAAARSHKPLTTLSPLPTNNARVATPGTPTTTTTGEEPPLKKPRLDLDTGLVLKNGSDGVIVINSDDSNDKENREIVVPHTEEPAQHISSAQNNTAGLVCGLSAVPSPQPIDPSAL